MANLEKRLQKLEFRLEPPWYDGPLPEFTTDELWEIVFPGIEPAICEQMDRKHPRLLLADSLKVAVSALRARMGGQALTAEQTAAIEEAVTSEDIDIRYFAKAFQVQADGRELTADQRACIEEVETIYKLIDGMYKEARKHKVRSVRRRAFVSLP